MGEYQNKKKYSSELLDWKFLWRSFCHEHTKLVISKLKKLLDYFMKKRCRRQAENNTVLNKWSGKKTICCMSKERTMIVL